MYLTAKILLIEIQKNEKILDMKYQYLVRLDLPIESFACNLRTIFNRKLFIPLIHAVTIADEIVEIAAPAVINWKPLLICSGDCAAEL